MTKIVVVPRPTPLTAINILDTKKLRKVHSTMYKYEDQEFICDVGAPTLGGWIVCEPERPLYYTNDKFVKKYALKA